MVLPLLGSIGIGMVWGWLIGTLEGHIHQPQRTIPAVSLATLLVIIEVFLIEGAGAVVVLLGAITLSLLIHVFWRRQLRLRYGLMNKISFGELS
jgi:hypothetical protein